LKDLTGNEIVEVGKIRNNPISDERIPSYIELGQNTFMHLIAVCDPDDLKSEWLILNVFNNKLNREQVKELGKIENQAGQTLWDNLFQYDTPSWISEGIRSLEGKDLFEMALQPHSAIRKAIENGSPEIVDEVIGKKMKCYRYPLARDFVLLDSLCLSQESALAPQVGELVRILGERAEAEPKIAATLLKVGVVISRPDISSPYQAQAAIAGK
jgi:hypothetical protein